MFFKILWLGKAYISRFTSRQDWQTEEAYPGLQVCTFSFFARLHITSPAHCSRCLRLRTQWDAEGVVERARVTEASIDYYIGTLS